jgi:hypothetical protein
MMLIPTCSARSAGRCLVRWHSYSFHSIPLHNDRPTFIQQQQLMHSSISKNNMHTQPSSERKFRGKRRSRRRNEGTDDDASLLVNDKFGHDRTSIGAEKATAFRRKSKRKPTVRVVFRPPGRHSVLPSRPARTR